MKKKKRLIERKCITFNINNYICIDFDLNYDTGTNPPLQLPPS